MEKKIKKDIVQVLLGLGALIGMIYSAIPFVTNLLDRNLISGHYEIYRNPINYYELIQNESLLNNLICSDESKLAFLNDNLRVKLHDSICLHNDTAKFYNLPSGTQFEINQSFNSLHYLTKILLGDLNKLHGYSKIIKLVIYNNSYDSSIYDISIEIGNICYQDKGLSYYNNDSLKFISAENGVIRINKLKPQSSVFEKYVWVNCDLRYNENLPIKVNYKGGSSNLFKVEKLVSHNRLDKILTNYVASNQKIQIFIIIFTVLGIIYLIIELIPTIIRFIVKRNKS